VIRYVDASIVVALIARQSASELVDRVLLDDNDLLISDLAIAESSSALARLGRVDRWAEPLTASIFEELDIWASLVAKPMEITSTDIADATAFVRLPGVALRAPDAIHIAAAQRVGATILTLDRGMARAADLLGVPCINPADEIGEQKN
jgi:predicted nucleic acid-binding protein